MAARKSSNAGVKRSTVSKKRNASKEKVTNESLFYENRYEIGFIVVTCFSLILFLANFGLIGTVGDYIKDINFGLFGLFAWIHPFFLFLATTFLIANKKHTRIKVKMVLSFFLLLVMGGIAELISYPEVASLRFLELYTLSSMAKNGGGFLGGILTKIIAMGMGETGAYIILFGLLIILLIFVTGNFFVSPIRRRAAETRDHILEISKEKMEEARLNAELKSEIRREIRVEKKSIREKLREEKRQKLEEIRLREERSRTEKEELEAKERDLSDREQREQERLERNRIEDETLLKAKIRRAEMEEARKVDTKLREIGSEKTSDMTSIIQGAIEQDTLKDTQEGFYRTVIEDKFGKTDTEEVLSDDSREEMEVEDFPSRPRLHWNLLERNDQDTGAPFLEEDVPKERDINLENSEEKEKLKEESVISHQESLDTDFEEYEAYLDEEEDILEEELTEPSLKEEFSVEESLEKKEVFERKEIDVSEETIKEQEGVQSKAYEFPPYHLLERSGKESEAVSEDEILETTDKLQKTLEAFGVKAKVTDVSCGPSVTRYELQPEIGVKVSKITSLADDIKLNLAAADIRIEAPIPGKAAVGIEVPNQKNSIVYFRDLIEDKLFQDHSSKISFAVGKDIGGQTMITDIAKMPHLLIAGATGSGKSVCINTLIMSLLYKAKPDEVKFIMIDPKVVELSVYNGIPHLLLPVVTDPKKAAAALNWAVAEMNRRYTLFADKGVRNIKGFNKTVGEDGAEWMPQIVIIVDELADLMMVSSKEVEESICRLAQLARAAGIHLVIATQRPSVNVITGLIKANIPSRIAFAVSSQVDSRTILDGAGAEKLLGKGDMLFFPSGYPKPVRVQGAFISDGEVSSVVDFIKANQGEASSGMDITEEVNAVAYTESMKEIAEKTLHEEDNDYDEYFEEAGKLIIEKNKASIGMLQRVYRIGFNRAARIMDQLAEAQVVSEEDGTRPRKILMNQEEFVKFLSFKNGESLEESELAEDETYYE